ncbi:hypothetical protein CHI95_18750 [Providencia rettgeri]|uniref:Fimbrial-type adhesion domain-containing protein n=3 Tax=Morganellaceae TaxID=1903414 RepID=A0A264VP53_PRORE|nr:fimbrial protein [Providencia rettgeri]EMB3084694.1 fimbrial protein [Providencia rettgeri]OZS73035.1 hypothetical protein CHI95_18750 [Providencia rettgeri]
MTNYFTKRMNQLKGYTMHRGLLKIAFTVVSCLFTSSTLAADSVTVNIKGNLILNPPCEISGVGNGPIEVDFKDMVIRTITGTNFPQPVPYTLKCDADGATNVALRFKGDGAKFNSNVLKTSNDNLGIRFATVSGSSPTFFALNTDIRFTNSQRPTIRAYPLLNPGVAVNSIAGGGFTSTVTLEASYP